MKMNNKMLVCDLDGTLLDRHGEIDQVSLSLIEDFCRDGGHFVICTGRMDTDIRFVEEKLGIKSEYRISQNGSVIYDKQDRLIFSKQIPSEYIKDLNDIIFSHNLRTEVSNIKNRLFPSPRDPKNVAEFVDSSIVIEDLATHVLATKEATIYLTFGSEEEFNVIRQQVQQALGEDAVNIVMTSPTSLEIFSREASKGKALQFVVDQMGIASEDLYVAGDAESDTTMFSLTPNAYAVQEADKLIIEAAGNYAETVADIVKIIYSKEGVTL